MTVEIKKTNNAELLQKKQDRLSALRKSTSLPSAEIEDLEQLANAGMLDRFERELYDDLRIALKLLGEDHRESA